MMDSELILEKAKKTYKFVWRHFFTLAIFAILLSVFIEAPLNWKNAFYMVATSLFLDWANQFIKLTPNARRHSALDFLQLNNSNSRVISVDNDSNPCIVGTSAYLRHSGNRYN